MLLNGGYMQISRFNFDFTMLEKSQLVELLERLGTPHAGQALILNARTNAPVRDVQSRGGNVITIYASRKMGCEIRTESRHIEFAAAVDHEYDQSVLAYYPQPCELKLELTDPATGEIHQIHHTPDFLVIRASGFTLEEWKSHEKLTNLAKRTPYRYSQDEEGHWRAPQIEKQLAEMGIAYRVYCENDLPRKRVENYLHLADYLLPGVPECPHDIWLKLQEQLQEQGSISIAELLAPPHNIAADDIYKAIADKLVVADLDRESLGQPKRAKLYRDVSLRDFLAGAVCQNAFPGITNFSFNLNAGSRFHYEGQEVTISLVGEKQIICTRQNGQTFELTKDWLLNALNNGRIQAMDPPDPSMLDYSRYTAEELDVALRRHHILSSANPQNHVSERTLARWESKQKAAIVSGGNEVLALIPRTRQRGNRSERLHQDQENLIQQIIKTKWSSHEARNYKACYRELLVSCAASNLEPASYPTLIARIKETETNHTTRARFGKRMAYQLDEFVPRLAVDTPIHGSRPFQYVHIDHTQLDIEICSGRTGKPLGRPWLTLAVDAHTRRIVAMYLTFDPPAYHSVMMIMRDMVKRFSRLPEFIVVDNGRDLISNAFESFLQAMGTHLRLRPAGQPRHGAVMERMFGRLHTEYIHNLAGNTKVTKNVRMTTGKHLPVNFAEWTIEELYLGIEYWATEFYDNERHPALDCSPREMYTRGLEQSGSRPQRIIPFNSDFLIATCPPVDREGVRLVNRQRGVKVNGLLYWNPEFKNPRIAGQSLPVRYDPWDATSVFVWFKDRWLHAVCRSLLVLGQLTEFERRAMFEEYTHQSGFKGLDQLQSEQRTIEWMQTFTPEGAVALAFERQKENKSLYNRLQLSLIAPVTSFSPNCLIEDTAPDAAESRSKSFTPSDTTLEAESHQLPDFDTF